MDKIKIFAVAACIVFTLFFIAMAILPGGSFWPRKKAPQRVENAPLFDSIEPGEYVGLIAASSEIAIVIVNRAIIHIAITDPETGCFILLELTYDEEQQEMRLKKIHSRINPNIIKWQ